MFERVAVIGTGLLGGSLAAGLRVRGLARHCVGYSPADGHRALAGGLVDSLADALGQAVHGADLVVLAAPVSINAGLMAEVAAALAPMAIVTDLSSVKQGVVAAACRALGPAAARYVPTHPIAGGERSGPEAADANLFEGRLVIVSPLAVSEPAVVGRFEALWQALGARTRRLDVAAHDEAYALVSHWPHAAAYALAASIGGRLAAYPASAELVGPGLSDMTRIAASDPALWADIVLANAAAVLDCADGFARELADIRAAIEAGDRQALVAAFDRGAQWRRGLAAASTPGCDPAGAARVGRVGPAGPEAD